MMAASFASKVVIGKVVIGKVVIGKVVVGGSFPSKLGRPKQKEAAREGHPPDSNGE
jgi:hypothetical protein